MGMKKNLEYTAMESADIEAFREATMELDNTYSLFYKACGLSEAEYWSLILIYEGVETQSKISDMLYFSRQTLNSAFKQLVSKGIIVLEPCENDQRAKKAVLTEEGSKFVEENIVHMHKTEDKAWSGLDEQERALLIGLTKKYCKLMMRSFLNLK